MSNVLIYGLIGLVAVGAAIVLVSFLVEAMRPIPATPERLSWAPDIPIQYVAVDGVRLRYIRAGEKPSADLRIDLPAEQPDRQGFSCGVERLDHYLKTQAGQDVRRRIDAVFVLTGERTRGGPATTRFAP